MNTGASYNQAMYDLQQLTNAPAGAVAGLVADLRAQVENGFLSPDNTDVAGTADYHTLISSSDINAIHAAAGVVLAQVQGITGTMPAAPPPANTYTPPTNSGSFNPGGGTAAAAGGGGSVTPQKIVSPTAPAATAAAAASPTTAPATSTAIVTSAPSSPTAPPAVTTIQTAPPKPGVSLGATVFIALGALLLGGVLVYMWQPELLGMGPKRNPVKRRRRKKRKAS